MNPATKALAAWKRTSSGRRAVDIAFTQPQILSERDILVLAGGTKSEVSSGSRELHLHFLTQLRAESAPE